MTDPLFQPYTMGSLELANRLVMAPMTRSRAIDNVPNDLMAAYYRQRAGAGLIVTEGTSPSPHGLGYPRIPGAYSEAQTAGWKKVADAVHEQVAVRRMLGGWVSREPHVVDDVVWGAAVCLAAEQETATAVLSSVRDGAELEHGAVA